MDYHSISISNIHSDRNIRVNVTLGELGVLNKDKYSVIQHFSSTFLNDKGNLKSLTVDYIHNSLTYKYEFNIPDEHYPNIIRYYTFSEKTIWPDDVNIDEALQQIMVENQRYKDYKKQFPDDVVPKALHYVRIIRKRGKSNDNSRGN